jgi:hypothetical protein
MTTRWHGGPFGAIALAGSLLVGCASGSPQAGAAAFRREHAVQAARIAATTQAVELEVSRLSPAPTAAQLEQLARAADGAHGESAQASAWNVAGREEEGAEEEDVPRAETQVTEGAGALASAMSVLQDYTRAPSAASLASFKGGLAAGKAQWNEGISQLWYLAHASAPPTL